MTIPRSAHALPLFLAAICWGQNPDLQDLPGRMAELRQSLQSSQQRMQQRGHTSNEDSLYDSGTRALDAGRWEEAASKFSEVSQKKGTRADGALYWKAYSENRMGQRDAALSTLAALKKDYPASRWLSDAQALEVEVRQQAGKPVSPDLESNDELKMLALNGLLHSDPDQAVPIIDKLLKSNNSPKLKERALFVLSQSNSPKAQQVLTETAKGGANPDLQSKAIRYIWMSGGKVARQQLLSLYNPAADINVKKQIIRYLGLMPMADTGDALVSLYGSEPDLTLKHEAVNSLFIQTNAKGLVELARKETNMTMKQYLVERLSLLHSKEGTAYLLEVLQK